MTNFGFILGCSVLAFGIFIAGYYINRAIQAAAFEIAAAFKNRKS